MSTDELERKDNVEQENAVIAQTKPHRRIFKIIVIGDSNVGQLPIQKFQKNGCP